MGSLAIALILIALLLAALFRVFVAVVVVIFWVAIVVFVFSVLLAACHALASHQGSNKLRTPTSISTSR